MGSQELYSAQLDQKEVEVVVDRVLIGDEMATPHHAVVVRDGTVEMGGALALITPANQTLATEELHPVVEDKGDQRRRLTILRAVKNLERCLGEAAVGEGDGGIFEPVLVAHGLEPSNEVGSREKPTHHRSATLRHGLVEP